MKNPKNSLAYYWDDPKDNRNEDPNNTLANKEHHSKFENTTASEDRIYPTWSHKKRDKCPILDESSR